MSDYYRINFLIFIKRHINVTQRQSSRDSAIASIAVYRDLDIPTIFADGNRRLMADGYSIETKAADMLYYQRYCKPVSEDKHTYHAH